MSCYVRVRALRTGLADHMWWLRVEGTFVATMIGYYLGNLPALPVEDLLRQLQITSAATRGGHVEDIGEIVAAIDLARRKRNDDVRDRTAPAEG